MGEVSREDAVNRLSSALGRLKAINILLDPILTKTREAIGSITRKRLEETRFMTKPPEQIRRAIEMLMHILSTADKGYMGLSKASLKRLNWRNDCLRPLRQSNILERLQTFVPHQLAQEPQTIQLLRDTYISPVTNVADAAEGVVSVSPSRMRRKSKRNRVLPMSVIGSSAITTTEAAKNAMLTAESVAYANATCGVLFNWSIHMLELADTLAKHGDLYAQREQAREEADQAREVLRQIDEKAQRLAEEAARLAEEEQERLAKEEQERLAKLERERLAKLEQERLVEIEQEQLAKLEKERLAKLDQERLAKEEQARLAKIEAARLAKEKQERLAKMEQQRLAKKEQDRLASQEDRLARRKEEHAAEIEKVYGQPAARGDGMHLASNIVLSQIPVMVRTVISFAEGDGVTLSSAATQEIDQVMQVMQTNPGLRVQIEAEYDSDLSEDQAERRTQAVESRLVRAGIRPNRVRTCQTRSMSPTRRNASKLQTSGGTVTISTIQEIQLVGTIQFRKMSSSVDLRHQRTRTILRDLAAVLRSRASALRLRVEGHTDSSPGWGQTNQQLSLSRATAVRSVLTGPDPEMGGVPEEVIGDRVVGWGATRPAQSNATRSGQQANRRVEFHIADLDTQKALRAMVGRQPSKKYGDGRGAIIGKDPGVRLYLQRLASGSEPSTWSVRASACAALVGLAAASANEDWAVLRLLFMGSRKGQYYAGRGGCCLTNLGDSLVRRICRMWFWLGGGR